MKPVNVLQNSEEWFKARLGKPTASSFDKIITAAGNPSAQWHDYLFRLLFERITKKTFNKPLGYWPARGRALEPFAAIEYERLTGNETLLGGFILTDDGKIGCSPDRIIMGELDHALEIKVPTPWQHMQYTLLGPGNAYRAQLQGQMYVGEFRKVSFFSYNPGMPCVVHTVRRDGDYIKKMHELLNKFVRQLDKAEKLALKLGPYDIEEMCRAAEEQERFDPVDDGIGL